MRAYRLVLPLALLLTSGGASATSLNFNLSGEAARLGVVQPLQRNGLQVGASWLHHEDDGDILAAGLHLMDDAQPGRGSLDIGVGAKIFLISEDSRDADGGALGIGGKFRWTWPTFNRFGIGGHAYYAPDVTSAGDIEEYMEAALRAEYLILRNANAYVGVRAIRIGDEHTGDTETFESGLHAGIRIEF